MKSTGGRIAVVAAVIAVVVVAFLLLRPTADEGGDGATTAQETGESSSGGGKQAGGKSEPKPKPKPAPTEIVVKDSAPVGGVEEIAVDSGEDVELVVDSDEPEEVHVHGYDEFADAAPGNPARLDFAAHIEGVFEIELEGSHVQIGRLEVTP
jgi:hypothetical protein